MFCTKCGTQNPEGAGFCVKCGAKLVTDNPGPETTSSTQSNAAGSAQPVSTPGSTGNSDQQASSQTVNRAAPPVQQWSAQPQQPYAVQQAPIKKKSKAPFIAIGAIVLVIAAVLFVVFGSGDNIDYVASVRAFQPFADSLDISYSYGEVLDKYISDAKWVSHKNDTGADVEISGTLSGTERDISIVVNMEKIPDNPDMSMISLKSVTTDGETISDETEVSAIIVILFRAYDEGYSNFAEIQDAFMSNELDEEVHRIGAIIEVNETKSYDYDEYDEHFQVTLDYVDFVDKVEVDTFGGYISYPEEECVYLRAAIQVKNLGTEKAWFTASNSVVYDNNYEFSQSLSLGNLDGINPLTSAQSGALIFEVPESVIESDKPIVLNIGNRYEGEPCVVFAIRGDESASKAKSATSSSTTTHESASEPVSVNFATVKEYLNDPEVRREIDATIAETNTDEMQLSVEATDDTLFYIFEFDGAALFDADLNAVTRELEDGLQSQADVFVGIAQDISSIVDVDNVKVVVIYKISTGNELCRGEFSAY